MKCQSRASHPTFSAIQSSQKWSLTTGVEMQILHLYLAEWVMRIYRQFYESRAEEGVHEMKAEQGHELYVNANK